MRLIDKDKIYQKAMDIIQDKAGWKAFAIANAITMAETIEAKPVKHGRWINRRSPSGTPLCECSVCGDSAISQNDSWGYPIDYYTTDFCGNCGAKMDGVTDNSKEDEYE